MQKAQISPEEKNTKQEESSPKQSQRKTHWAQPQSKPDRRVTKYTIISCNNHHRRNQQQAKTACYRRKRQKEDCHLETIGNFSEHDAAIERTSHMKPWNENVVAAPYEIHSSSFLP